MSHEDVKDKIPAKPSDQCLRLVSFNVNGVKTLKNYYPWNERPGYDEALTFMKADIITFQELKLQRNDIDTSIANPTDYLSFITIPQKRKGYSGVGIFVRKPTSDCSDIMRKALTVEKVEEGITGYLHLKKAQKSYRDCIDDERYKDLCIGGYPDLDNSVEGRHIDSEGRCILIEVGIGLVIIAVYCPANSGSTEEGEEFRLSFLQCLFERARNLLALGKQVVILGDINVSPDLIDSDESISDGLTAGKIKKPYDPANFEKENKDQVTAFKTSTKARKLLNAYLYDTSGMDARHDGKVLHDVTREIQGRKLKMYSVWNTQKNNRPMNIGSRIDLFLVTTDIARSALQSDIWPFLYGSDHCPIFCDFDLSNQHLSPLIEQSHYNSRCSCKHLQAKHYYCLGNDRSIASFFKKPEKTDPLSGTDGFKFAYSKKRKNTEVTQMKHDLSSSSELGYRSRKHLKRGQQNLSAFLSVKRVRSFPSQKEPPCEKKLIVSQEAVSSLFVAESESDTESESNYAISNITEQNPRRKNTISAREFNKLLKSSTSMGTPFCYHDEPCVLRTVKKEGSKNFGKKFWCCGRHSRNMSWNLTDQKDGHDHNDPLKRPLDEYECGFFKWVSKM